MEPKNDKAKIATDIPDDLPKPPMTEESYRASVLKLCSKVDETRANKFQIPGKQEKKGFLEQQGLYYDDTVQFPDTDEDQVVRSLGRKWRENIHTLLGLASSVRHLTNSKHTIVLYFALTSGRLLEIFGNSSAIYNAIQLGLKCGLLIRHDSGYDHTSPDPMNHLCMMYAWNRRVEEIIDTLAKREKKCFRKRKSVRMKRAKRNHGKLVQKALAKTNGKPIRIAQSASLPLELTDDEIVSALRDFYPQLAWAQDLAIRLNQNFKLPDDEQISANPKVTRAAKSISKIGFRITNPLVSAKEHHNENDANFTGRWRKDVLADKLGKWAEYDVKSSIYRVAYLINHGVWLPRDQDLYSMMAGFEFPTAQDRDNYKALAMKLYFDDSAKSIVHHLVGKGVDKCDASEGVIEEARKRMFDVCGASLKSEIFLHEGCIYLEAFRRMVEERRWRVIQVYDGFYIRLDDGMEEAAVKDEVDRIVTDCAYWYRDKFLGGSTGSATDPRDAL